MTPLLSVVVALAAEPTVLTLDEALRLVEAATRPAPPPLPPPWTIERSTLTVHVQGDTARVVAELRVVTTRAAWIDLPVLDGQVRLDNRASAIRQGPDGAWWLTTRLDGAATFRLEGTIPVRGASLKLRVAPGVRQQVLTQGEGLVFEVDGLVAGYLPPSDTVMLSWRPDAPRAAPREVVLGEVAAAAWWEDEALRARARVRFEVRRGERQSFSVRLPAGAQEVAVTGPGLLRWERSGDTLSLTAREPVRGAFEVTVAWRQPFAGDLARVSAPEPLGVTSSSATLTLSGSSESLLSPTATGGLRTVALSEIPERDRAIGDAPPAAAWAGRGALEIRTLRLESIEGPPLVIDKARCTVAYAESGRALMNCALDLRNISRQYLVIQPGEGTELWAARVNGDGVPPVLLDGGAMAIPLEKSVETVAGLLTLDVQLTFMSAGDPWLRRGEKSLALPTFDAPVARMEWELRLPPGYRGEARGGSARVMTEASTTIVYASTAPTPEQAVARETANLALRAYQANDFDTAQTYIDQTLALDPGNANANLLQGNLDVLSGGSAPAADEAMSRRVKDLAKAKVSESEILQEEAMRKAEESLAAGDYDRAMAEAERAMELSKDLSRYEQRESSEQQYRASSSGEVYKKAAEQKRSNVDDERRTPAQDPDASGARYDGEWEAIDGAEPALTDDLEAGIGGLIGARGEQLGSGGLGARGSGLGGGGTAEGLGGLGTKGMGSGASGYGSGGGNLGALAEPDDGPAPIVVEDQDAPVDVVDAVPVSETTTVSRDFVQRVPTGRSYQSAVSEAKPADRGRAAGLKQGKTASANAEMPLTAPISATTLAIPLPDHGVHVEVAQSLLEPGESTTLTLRYRQQR